MSYDSDAVRAAVSVLDLARRIGVELRRSGGWLRGACPLCAASARRPFSVAAEGDHWVCHSCDEKGDVFALYQRHHDVDFAAAVRELASLGGVAEDDDPAVAAEREARARKAAAEREAKRARADRARQRKRAAAEKRADRYWEWLDRHCEPGLAYLRRRGVSAAAADVRYLRAHDDDPESPPRWTHACVALRDAQGKIANVVRRRLGAGEPKVSGLKGAGPKGAFGDLRVLADTEGPIVITEGVFDWLTARAVAPDRLVLGAHGAHQIATIVELVLAADGDAARVRGLVFVPHRDENRAGQRAVNKGIAVARAGNVDSEKIRVVRLERRAKDLNDQLLSLGPLGIDFDRAPTIAEQDRELWPLTDLGHAKRFAALHADSFRYVPETGQWLAWDGRSWSPAAADQELVGGVDDVVDALEREAEIANPTDPELAESYRSASRAVQGGRRIAEMIRLARSRAEIRTPLDRIDSHPFLLSVENGTLDLRSGQLRPHQRGDLITSCAPVPYAPDATAPRWYRFLAEVFEPNPDACEFVRRYAGYSLTGDTSAQCLLFAKGDGRNGKGVLLRRIQRALGRSLAGAAARKVFVETRHGDTSEYGLAGFLGKRALFVSEFNPGDRIAEGVIKEITGGDPVTARHPAGRYFEYQPQFKLWMSSNHFPQIRGTDAGIWSRFRVVPFHVSFADRLDPDLDRKLDAELPGILAWAVGGCLDWLADGGGLAGLGAAASVADATESYRAESDQVGRFLEACCVTSVPSARVWSDTLYLAYRAWSEAEGMSPRNNIHFGRQMAAHGHPSTKVNGKRCYPVGLLREVDE